MATPFIGEIRMFAGTFAPLDWAFCDGAAISIAENPILFQLIGTTYGGDGVNTYNLPDLRSRVPIHQGSAPFGTFVIGQPGGVEQVALTSAQIGLHTHTLQAVSNGMSVASPAPNAFPAPLATNQTGAALYGTGNGAPTQLSPSAIGHSPGGQPHSNLQPYLAVNFIIALFGIFPSQG